MSYPKVSIIILNWNGLEGTIECLESLRRVTYPNYEVIVVDNGSKGNDAQVLQERFSDYIHLIKNDKNYGFAGGNNIGIRYAMHTFHPDYVLLLNNDTVVDPEFLTEMVRVPDNNPGIGITGSKIYYYDNPNQLQFVWGKVDFWRGQVTQTPKVLSEKIKSVALDKGQYDHIAEADWVTGCCFLVKRSVLENIGLLDESYFSYWEETDYCIRAKKANYRIAYVPKAKVWHKLERSVKKVTGFTRYFMVRNRFRFMRKHATKWQYRCFLIYFFGFYFWLATVYYLIYLRSPMLLASFHRAVRDGLFNSESRAGFYIRD